MTYQQPPAGWNGPQQPVGGDPQRPNPPHSAMFSPAPSPIARVGSFTLREVLVFALTLVLLIASFLPLVASTGIGYTNLWSPMWLLGIPGVILPVVAAALLLLQRTMPSTRWRVGSLSVDQFASVIAIIAAASYLGVIIVVVGIGAALRDAFGGWVQVSVAPGVGPVLGLVLSLALITVTTVAPLLPPFSAEFQQRTAVAAPLNARPLVALPARERPASPAAQGWPQPGGPQMPYGQPYAPAGHAPTGFAPQPASQTPLYAPQPSSHPASQHEPASPPAADPQASSASSGSAEGAAASPDAERTAPETTELAPDVEATVVRGPQTASAEDDIDEDDAGAPDQHRPVSASTHVNSGEDAARTTPPTGPFWVWAPEPRDVLDEATGMPVFSIGPGAWALAVDDRGSELVIRHDDGRVGVLRDIEGLTRS
ncbi:hypothetical protein SAMN04489806_3043 [Paramicrobacterium humi]|uniref:Uncharacterized protein n=1 Tax=Paramicrobacterium humi TaxID=640635 RepID=A0A1H4R9L3_9MICO|nr:hypothetical protein [Microbacterium humi]SEC28600.1 hypothetical protein SAMN04489806_3043 [Microbacterium humi]